MKTLSKNILIVLSFLLLNEVVYTQCNSLIINAGSNQAICSGQSVQIGGNPTISNTLSNSTFSFNWSPNSNISSISASNPTVNPTTTTKYYLYVQQTDSLGVICNAVDSVTVTVNPLPNVILNNFSSLCIDAGSIALSGGSPTGGNYSGNGVLGNSFTPSTAGVGTHSITYSYTDANGCSSSATKNIVVNPLPVGYMVPSPYSIIDNYNPNATTWTKCQLFDTIFNFSMKIQASSVQNNTPSTKYDLVFGNGDTAFNALPNVSYSTAYTYEFTYNLELIITDTLTGCSSSFNRELFWGKNAQLILTEDFSMGNSGFCAPVTLRFPVVYGTPNSPNSPGTSYTISINDGTPGYCFYSSIPGNKFMV